MAEAAPIQIRKTKQSPTSQTILREQEGHELVFAIVGHIGSGVSHAALMLKAALEDDSLPGGRFDVTLLKARDEIVDWARRTRRTIPDPVADNVDYITRLQDLGDEMREGDHAAVANALIRRVRLKRAEKQGKTDIGAEPIVPDGKPRAFILDSIRHPMEVHLLRSVYRSAFTLIGVVCEEQKRVDRLVAKLANAGEKRARELMQRDAKAPEKFGQRVGDAFHLADIFLDNSADQHLNTKPKKSNPDWDVPQQLQRLVQIITHAKIVRPTPEETAMHVAYGAQVRSACLSRQVGASIIDGRGVVVSTGTNEVPRAGGGVYGNQEVEPTNDHRCAYRALDGNTDPYCSNTKEQIVIANELVDVLVEKGLVKQESKDAVIGELRKSRIGSLLEFSRAVHAEMDALLNAARSGKSTHGARMFVTTFPCHYCARHIVAGGIDEVQYIEPYPKSQALKLHDDSIRVDAVGFDAPSKGKGTQVLFRPFHGVAPRMYPRAFLKDRELKNDATGVMQHAQPDWGSTFELTRVSYADMEALLAKNGGDSA